MRIIGLIFALTIIFTIQAWGALQVYDQINVTMQELLDISSDSATSERDNSTINISGPVR